MKCDVWKPCGDQRWQDELQFSIWRFFEQIVFVNNHLLCYWPTIHNSISKICPKFQNPSSHFFEVDELFDEQWAKIVQSENISTQIYVACIRCINQRFAFKNSGILCLALIFNLSNPSNPFFLLKKNGILHVMFCNVQQKKGCIWRSKEHFMNSTGWKSWRKVWELEIFFG